MHSNPRDIKHSHAIASRVFSVGRFRNFNDCSTDLAA
jgi:hypothetical protein